MKTSIAAQSSDSSGTAVLDGDQLGERAAVARHLVHHRRVLALVEDASRCSVIVTATSAAIDSAQRMESGMTRRGPSCVRPRRVRARRRPAPARTRRRSGSASSGAFLSARSITRRSDERQVGAQLVERRRVGLGDLVGDADQRVAVEGQVRRSAAGRARRRRKRGRIARRPSRRGPAPATCSAACRARRRSASAAPGACVSLSVIRQMPKSATLTVLRVL